MTYALFLLIFLGLPILLAIIANWLDLKRTKTLPITLSSLPAWLPLVILVVLAVAYTTPWDNYLVATRVWYYNPELVTGMTIGWVPIEEYTFFILQTIMTGLWVIFLGKRITTQSAFEKQPTIRRNINLLTGAVWVISVTVFFSGWRPGTYLSLILVWALPPIMLQLAFGADILWHHRRLVSTTLLATTFYLGLTDSLAIAAGTWTIDPRQSLNIFIAGVLPLEEFIFFLVTNTLIVFGLVLALAHESNRRANLLFQILSPRSKTA
jgi:lycopene beta-cyclase